MRRKELLDAPSVQPRFGRQREPRQLEAVVPAQAEARAVHDVAVAVDEARPVVERVASTEGEEFFFDGNSWIACRRDRIKRVECAAELIVKDRTRQVVAALRTAAQKEPAPHPLIRLVDRDVLAGHSCVPDETCGRRESAKPAPDNVRLHLPPPEAPGKKVLSTRVRSNKQRIASLAKRD